MRLRFADCVFDPDARELRRNGSPVALSPLAFRLLGLLLESRPRPLPHRELKDALWPDTHVGYASLAKLVSEARKAVGDSARTPTLLRTVHRFGYAFCGSAVAESSGPGSSPGWALVAMDREYGLAEGDSTIGRGAECRVRLASDQVSRRHARIRLAGGVAVLEDLGSKNGTWLNGDRLEAPAALADGDQVGFGSCRLVFRSGLSSVTTRSGSPD